MFDQIVIRRHNNAQGIDAGALAETLLFYQNVHLLLGAQSIETLCNTVGPDNLLRLINDGRITATVLTDNLGAHSTNSFGVTRHNFSAFSISQHADGRKFKNKHIVQTAFERALGKGAPTRSRAEAFLKHVEYSAHQEGSSNEEQGLIAEARADLADEEYVKNAVREKLLDKIPDLKLPDDWRFKVIFLPGGEFRISTDLDFVALNADPRSENALNEAQLVLGILEARADLNFAARYMSEIVTTEVESKIIQLKFGQFLARRFQSDDAIKAFQDIHLENAKAIREAINSGERTFDEFLQVLDEADKFKCWLKGVNPDAKLLNEYYSEVTRESWADKLPAKTSRFAMLTIAGLLADGLLKPGVGTAAGIGMGAVDAYWVDQLVKGWRPNQFVNGALKDFIDI